MKPGDGWTLIASRNQVRLGDLLAANKVASVDAKLYPGNILCLRSAPAPTTTVAPPTTVPPTLPAQNAPRWKFIGPQTAFDSAWTKQPIAPGVRQWVRIDRTKNVPVTTTGVVLRLTARSAGASGLVATYRCDAPVPAVSQLSFAAGETAVGTSMVEVVGGAMCVSVSSPAHVKIEVLAFNSPTGVGAQPVPARRALDTRTTTRLAPGVKVPITPAALGVVPGTQALTASVTVVGPAAAGTLSLGFCDAAPWRTPFPADQVWSFSMTMRINASGWCVSSTVATDVIVDVNTVWAGSNGLRALDPARVFDSRSSGARVGTKPVTVKIAGQKGVPANAKTVVLSVTTITGGSAASVHVVPCGQKTLSGTVTAQSAGETTTGSAVVSLANGAVCVSSTNPADVSIDVIGYA